MAIELSYEELDGYIQQICSGKKFTYVKNHLGQEMPLIFVYPTLENQQIADHIYKGSLQLAQEEELPSMKEMEEIVRSRGLFTEVDEAKIKKLHSRIEGQRFLLSKTIRVPANTTRIKDNIERLQKEIQKIELKRELNYELTQERKAAEEKFLFLTRCGVLDPINNTPYWKNEEMFNGEKDFVLRKRVFLEYIIFAHGLTQPVIRYIARSNLWRIRYVTAIKTGDSLFGRPINQYTVDQLTLMYWSHFYQSVYEMLPDDRPSESIIEDDEALDAYMKDWQAEKSRDSTASKAKKNNKYGQNSAWDHKETLVMKSNPMHQDIEYSKTLPEHAKHSKDKVVDAAPMGRKKRGGPLDKAKEKK